MIELRQEAVADASGVETLLDEAFGKDRYSRLAYKFRVDVHAVPELCLVAYKHDQLVGSIRFWPLVIPGTSAGLLLGPIAVYPQFSRLGIGSELIQTSLALAKSFEHEIVVAFGSHRYLGRFGFCNKHNLRIENIIDIDQDYFLALELKPGARSRAKGFIKKMNT